MAKKTSIGGQALIEGIMMKGPEKTSIAIRMPDHSISLEYVDEHHAKDKYKFLGWPVIRGVTAFIESMVSGYKALMLSADKSGYTEIEDEEEKQKYEQLTEEEKLKKEKKDNAFFSAIMVIATILGVVLALVLFMYLPALAFKGINYLAGGSIYYLKGLIEGIIKMIIFVAYIAVVSLEKDIKRVFMYHGAEHKSIFCYESGEPLTVENVRKQVRLHPRCGTSFIFLMLFVSILVSSLLVALLPKEVTGNNLLWVPIKILIVPLICGFGYELLKFTARHDNLLTRIIVKPGLWIQKLTTKEPDDHMIEVAIEALTSVIPEDPTKDELE